MALSEALESMDISTWAVVAAFSALIIAFLVYLGMKVPLVWTIARFGYSNARYNSRINRFVRRLYVNNLLGTNSFGEAVNFISSTNARDFPLKSVTTTEDAEQEMFSLMVKNIEEAKRECPKIISPVLDNFILRYENQVLKALLRKRFFRESLGGEKLFPVGSMDEKTIENMRNAESLEELISFIHREELRNIIKELGEKTYPRIENQLDRYYLTSIENSAKNLPKTIRGGLGEFLQVHIDMINLKTVLRTIERGIPEEERKELVFTQGKNVHGSVLDRLCEAENIAEAIEALGATPYGPLFRELFKDYKKTGRISLFELELDRFWINYVENFAMKMNSTVGPVIRYLTEQEFEIRNVMSVLRGLEIPGGKEIAEELMVVREAS